jgi:hypothetical protein
MRVDSVPRKSRADETQPSSTGGNADGTPHLYTRNDPDARAHALDSTEDKGCRERRWGRWIMSLCPEPEDEKPKVGGSELLRLQIQESRTGGLKPATGVRVSLILTHLGEREVREVLPPEPVSPPVKETSPGGYEANVVFPSEGQWSVEARTLFPGGETGRFKFEMTVDPASDAPPAPK